MATGTDIGHICRTAGPNQDGSSLSVEDTRKILELGGVDPDPSCYNEKGQLVISVGPNGRKLEECFDDSQYKMWRQPNEIYR